MSLLSGIFSVLMCAHLPAARTRGGACSTTLRDATGEWSDRRQTIAPDLDLPLASTLADARQS